MSDFSYPKPNPLFLGEQVSDPATPDDVGALYTKNNAGVTDLYYREDNNGAVVQLTNAGGVGGIDSINGDVTPNQLIVGVANRISVGTAAGTTTIQTPQDIATISSPTFANITITSKAKLGSTATFTDRLWDFSETVTTFTGGVTTKFLESNVSINSSVNLTTSPVQGAAFVTTTASANTKNYADIRGTVSDTYHTGSGTVTSLISGYFTAANTGVGPITTMNGFVTYSQNASSATIGENRGAYIQFGNSTGAGTITNNYGLRLVPYNLGTVTNNIGIKIEDMTGGSSINTALQTGIGLVQFGDKVSIANRLAVGNDATLVLNGAFDKFIDFSQTITDFTASGSFQGLTQYINFAPTVDLTGGNAKYLYVSAQEAFVPVGNTKNIQQVEATYTRASHQGSGTVNILYGNITQTDVTGLGSVSALTAQTIISTFASSGTANVNLGISLTSGATAGTVTTDYSLYINTPDHAGTMTSHYGLYIDHQNFGTTNYALFTNLGKVHFGDNIDAAGTLKVTGIIEAVSSIQIDNGGVAAVAFGAVGLNHLRLYESTGVGGLDFLLTTTNETISTISQANATLLFQNQIFTPGAAHIAAQISPAWAAENFSHTSLLVRATSNGANSSTVTGLNAVIIKNTGATTLDTAQTISVTAPSVTGTITNAFGIIIGDHSSAGGTVSHAIKIASQSANATTTRAIEIAGSNISNAIRLGSSANIYSSAANNIRLADSTNVGGLDFNFTTTSTTINTVTQNAAQILFQTQTLTPGVAFSSIVMNTTFASENFNHNQLFLNPTQVAGNTQLFQGLVITMNKTGGGTLATMNGVSLLAPAVTATVTASNALRISDQSNANITSPRGIRFTTAGVANSIVWGGSALQYATGTDNITFTDNTNAGGFLFSMTAASAQTVASTFGNLNLNCPTTNSVAFQVNAVTVGSINVTEFIASNGQKGKVTTSAAGVYSILLTDFIIAKTGITGGGDIVTLPSAVTAGSGKIYRIKDQTGTAATNNITVNATAGNIDGAASKAINLNYGSFDFYSDGSNWFIV